MANAARIPAAEPEATHQFYTDASSVVRVDGNSSESASALGQIHTLITSRIFTNFHIKTVNSLESWNGGVQVEKGYFVLNDMFILFGNEVIDESPEIGHSNDIIHSHPYISDPFEDEPASNYPLEEEAREYMESVRIEADNLVEEYKFQEHQHEPEAEYEAEDEDTVLEAPADFLPLVTEAAQEPRLPAIEHASEPQKFSYASILRIAKGKPAPPVIVQRPAKNKMPASDPHVPQSIPAEPVIQNVTSDIGEEGLLHESGEMKSVYVKNLPPTATTLDLLQEFKNFGKIKKDGIFLRHKKEIPGICLAFVEFEDARSVGKAVKASPIQVAGRQVYIGERRPITSGTSCGGQGRGRGGRFFGRAYGRNSDQYNSESKSFGYSSRVISLTGQILLSFGYNMNEKAKDFSCFIEVRLKKCTAPQKPDIDGTQL
ncbi:RNA metabolism protein [Lithospermum erythrorhizon]|uniref:RNA metabolism protein n=1 Tax=Lithospermum erythrorhizon TaxID=34254 RepID=A0AAV3NZ28_LITER